MQQIRSSEPNFNNKNSFRDKEIIVDNNLSLSEKSFKKCKFVFENNGQLHLDRCLIENCSFIGLDNYENYQLNAGKLSIANCNHAINIILKGTFIQLSISNSEIQNLIDNSEVKHFDISSSKIFDFTIRGTCNDIFIDGSKFYNKKKIPVSAQNDIFKKLCIKLARFYKKKSNTSIWDKEILMSAMCRKTIFDKVKINPFYFATKCDDKTSLDLTSAELIDDWSKLRKRYTGLSLFIVFLLTFVFFLPYLTHSFVLILSSRIDLNLLNIELIPLCEALLYGGKEGWSAILYATLTLVLLVYNITRILMTISISKLREEERFLKDANFQLVSIHPSRIKNHIKFDKFLSIIFWISLSYSLLKIIDTLQILVPSFH